ncbi:MAG TPA: Maf family protein [Candidatus Binataceae bacterium]|nr:Maf family protein [Candidatus Binataceae bacterium]
MPSSVKASSLILASGSPRRRDLLTAARIPFVIHESKIDEIRREGEEAVPFALRMAREKALSVAEVYPGEVILAADTIVELDGEVLGKPSDAADACRILRLLSDRTHRVVTAYALVRNGRIIEAMPVISHVTFRALTRDEIERYLMTGEPFDKAGAYGIQGMGANFIVAVEGDRSNVMGLPVKEVLAALARLGISPSPSPAK